MLALSFNRFYVVTKLISPTVTDISFLKFNFKDNCECLRKRGKGHNHRIEKCILDLIAYCRKIKPYIHFYKQQIISLNNTVHHILENEIDIVLPKIPPKKKKRKEKYFCNTYIRFHRFSL